MKKASAGIRSLAVAFPSEVRDNAFFTALPARAASRDKQPKLWAAPDTTSRSRIFDEEMARFVGDPFRGTVMRRTLGKNGKSLPLEAEAAKRALDAAKLDVSDVDLLLVGAFIPDQIGVGNAAFLANALGYRGPSCNFETACSSAVVGLQHACAFVTAGLHRRVLVVVSCDYTTHLEDTDSLACFMGDGAAAFIVEDLGDGYGLLGGKTISTADTCGAFFFDETLRMRADAGVNQVLRDTAEEYVRAAVNGAVEASGVALSDVDFFVFNTPNAWYARFCARAIGVDTRKTISAYPLYANVGPVLTPANLHLAASLGRVKDGDRVLMYAVGSVSTASATIMRWKTAALGPEPAPGLYDRFVRELEKTD